MDQYDLQANSAGWLFFVKASFVIALLATIGGIILLPGDLIIKGYFALCALFLVSATITMAKTVRDEHEAQKLINKISEARTTKMIKEYGE